MNKLLKKATHLLPDKAFIKIKYYYHFHKFPNLKNPQTFNEKLQWLKLYDRKPIYNTMVDKYEAKKYVADLIGEEYVIPSYGVWESFYDIDFDSLPEQFVLKTTHDCGGVVICKDKATFDKQKAKEFLERHLKFNYFYEGREWPYKDVKPRILAEAYMENASSGDLKAYKIFAFDGIAKALFVASDRQNKDEEVKFDFYDMDFKHLDIKNGHPNSGCEITKPASFEEMKTLAERLSKDIPHLRVDFYEVNGKAYVGELTLYHFSGMVPFEPEDWDEKFGSWIKLPENFGGGYALIGNGYVLWLHEKNIKPLEVYKVFNFDGEPYMIQAIQNDKTKDETIDYFDMSWNKLELKQNYPNSDVPLPKPECLEEISGLARKMSKCFPTIRTDFYIINGRPYFSEYTFYSDCGLAPFEPEEWDYKLGKTLRI